MNSSAALVLLISSLAVCAASKSGYVKVTGKLLCDGKPLTENVRLIVKENDVLDNDRLDEVKPHLDGSFELAGSQAEIGGIDPWIYIYHKCKTTQQASITSPISSITGFLASKLPVCWYRLKQRIPKANIATSASEVRPYDLGTIELKSSFGSDAFRCII